MHKEILSQKDEDKVSISLTDWRYKIDRETSVQKYVLDSSSRSQKAWYYTICLGNVWVAVFISGHHNCVLSILDWLGAGACYVHVQPSHQWTIEHATSNVLYHIRSWSQSKLALFILDKSREGKTCLMCVSPGDQWPLWARQVAAACPAPGSVGSQKISRPWPLTIPRHVPVCSVFTSQAHYNANDTAAAQWSFMSSLFTTSNVCPLLHTFAFYRLYDILYQIKCCGDECWFY